MSNSFNDFAESLDSDLSGVPTKTPGKYAPRQFTCESCNGTGLWLHGRMNRHGNNKCNTCHGQGTMATSASDRRAKREKAATRKADLRTAAKDDNLAHDGLFPALLSMSDWNSFASSLVQQHAEGRTWTDKQVSAARSMVAKVEAKKAERAAAKKALVSAAPTVDLQPIRAMFDSVVAQGFKRPKYRAEGFIVSLAPAHGVNAGALYVKSTDDVYMGKLVGDKFHGTRDSQGSGVDQALQTIAADPLGAAVRYGNATGSCACCGRELTKYESIARGIGPVCAERWGLTDVKWGMDPKAAKADLDEEFGK